MLTANRTHRHFNLPINRSFDVDRYLDENPTAPRSIAISEGNRTMHINTATLTPEQLRSIQRVARGPQRVAHSPIDTKAKPAPQFRNWAIRVNDWIERRMDKTDWHRVDMVLGAVGGFVLTGAVLYFLFEMADAVVVHAFQNVVR